MAQHPRLGLALAPGGLVLPEGRIAVFGPRAGQSLDPLPRDLTTVITPVFPDHAWFRDMGYDTALAPEGRFAAAVVILPRAKALARLRIAEAAAVTDGPVIVDGMKEDGIESVLKDARKRAEVAGPVNKAHGKLFWFTGGDLTDWAGSEHQMPDGFVTAAGNFSADGIDAGSAMLAAALPAHMPKRVIDLGAGWGYLSAQALTRPGIESIELVEADHSALDCARQNITSEAARFHWADATTWQPRADADMVICNPPFHTARKADPELGRSFIRTAATALKPKGELWLVANRHLPYEPLIAELFRQSEEIAGDTRFKVIRATQPTRAPKRGRLG
ncbi:class I SAM-dependent methyltransferase [Pseudooceanicola sp. C21-150M6]|uniref:class I SAM-dependent methyltransferase n=1 Tax=Pseudooceanicola sp. C21-150M6 TaxID=3434355 RepID=UPI003D7F63F8